eukprot:10064916-Alexandrium_andersonii.AAC.1
MQSADSVVPAAASLDPPLTMRCGSHALWCFGCQSGGLGWGRAAPPRCGVRGRGVTARWAG